MKPKTLNLVIAGLYLISLFTYSFTGSGGILGVFALFFGGFSITTGHWLAFGVWTANIPFLIAFLRKLKPGMKLSLSGIALTLGLLALLANELPMHMGSTSSPVKIGIGFYFWIGSLALLVVKNLMEFTKLNQE